MIRKYLIYIIYSVSLPFFFGCSSLKHIDTDVSKTDTIFKYVEKVDSVIKRDSVYVNMYAKGDTIYKERVRVQIRERIRIKTDTIFKSKIDSVKISVPVEKNLTKWQETKMKVGGFSISAILLILVCLSLYAILRRFKR